jgi:two-component system, NarL family, sensor histidine kinase YdfH
METKTLTPTPRPSLRRVFNKEMKNLRPVWPFFGLLTLAMLVLYGLTVANVAAMRQPWLLAAFSLLLLVHTALHWLSPLAAATRLHSAMYIFLQMVVVLTLILMTHYESLIYGLFMGLIGEMLGVIRPFRRSLIAIFCLLAAMFTIHGLLFGWGGILPFIVTIMPVTFFVVIYVYLFTRQMEEKIRAENLLEDLEIAHQQLSEYAVRIEELTLTNERQRMARELHDTLSQGLAGIILQLEAASEHQEQGNYEKASSIVTQAITHARSTLAEARHVIDDLREVPQSSSNLADFIKEEAEHFTSLTGLPCETSVGKELPISDELKLQIKKIVSEGLTNTARHAHASRSWVKIAVEGEQLQLEIGDDGQGFAVKGIGSNNGHYGLVGIRERVRLYGGTFKIESGNDEGTRLLFTFPLNTEGVQ